MSDQISRYDKYEKYPLDLFSETLGKEKAMKDME